MVGIKAKTFKVGLKSKQKFFLWHPLVAFIGDRIIAGSSNEMGLYRGCRV